MDLGNGLELLQEWFYKELEDTKGGNQNQLIKLNVYFFFFFSCGSKKWQNNQRTDGGRILVEIEREQTTQWPKEKGQTTISKTYT